MKYAYIGETTRHHAEMVMARRKDVVITGEYANGNVELAVPATMPEKAINLYIKAFERGRL